MERPWLMLRRVLDVDPPADDDGLHADEGEEGDAQIEAQIEVEEFVLNVNTNQIQSEAGHLLMGAGGPNFAPDFVITVARPPLLSSLLTGPGRAHPNRDRRDRYPYIIATGRFCLLVHFSVAPFYGTNFNHRPEHSRLAVARHFLRDDGGADIAACAVPVPDRPVDDLLNMPALRNIQSVGLVCIQGTHVYQVAELMVTTGAPDAVVVYIGRDTGVWQEDSYPNPLLGEDRHRNWVPHGTVTVNDTFVWYDLSWGIITCDLAQPHIQRVLNFRRLPRGRVLRDGAGVLDDLHCRRCIAVSGNLVRYVEIILSPDQAPTVNMWYRDVEDNPGRWITNYRESFAAIWGDASYGLTRLPPNPPLLAGVSPVDSNVVYFTLNDRLFGVNVPEHRVVHCEAYAPLYRPGPLDDDPVTSRYLITWNLDDNGAINIGHHNPGEHSDHEDSGDSGPMDEGEMDYEAP